jgi:tRNA-(ms[2]io[6]A)-hydroxylase
VNLSGLIVPTPPRWLDAACERWQDLLLDHANCEKKAASTALALIFAYPEETAQNLALARLAREELRHFEQVTRMLERLAVPFQRLKPGRYAAGLRAALRTHEPQRRLDLLLSGAIIEARSRERFQLLSARLPEPLGSFYGELERAEARHAGLYLDLAGTARGDYRQRLNELLAVEAVLIESDDALLRFHSGPPPWEAASADGVRGNVTSS